jgi:uncharacterized membrane protein
MLFLVKDDVARIVAPRPKQLAQCRYRCRRASLYYYCCGCCRSKLPCLLPLWLLVAKCWLPCGVFASSLDKHSTIPAIWSNDATPTSLSSSLLTTRKQERRLRIQTVSFTSSQPTKAHEPLETSQHLGLRLVTKLRKLGLPDALVLFIISSLPVLELRGAIPIGVWMGLSLVQVYFLSVLGNLFPVPLLLLGLKHRKVQLLFARLLKRAERTKQQIANETFREVALALFVGIPLPGTGAWSGALIAFVLNMSFWGATVSITCGVLMAGLIMLVLTKMGRVGGLIALSVLMIAGVSALWKTYKASRSSTNTDDDHPHSSSQQGRRR